MTNVRLTALCIGLLFTWGVNAQDKLTGTPIGSTAVDYNTSQASTTVNTPAMAFDGNLDTYYASYDRSYTWVGLDLGTPHVITKVEWAPRNFDRGPERVRLAVFEGANEADFSDAVPLYIIKEKGTLGQYSQADVNVSRGFRYVRYVGPSDVRCNVAELGFYGYEGEGDDSQFYQCTNLPLVVIHTKDNVEPYDKENEIDGFVSIISKDGTKILSDTATTRLRGNASKDFPKKPYRIKFASKHHVLGSPAKARRWTLINNYGDKTLMRNIVAFELSRCMEMEYTPFCQPVDVMLNGEYKGCYQLCDQVEVHNNRVPVEKLDSSGANNGYLIEIDAYAEGEDNYFKSNRGNPVTIKYPKADEISSTQTKYIQQYFNTLETRLYSSQYTTSTGYRSRLDLTSFLRNLLVGEMSGNTDTYWSTYMYKFSTDPLLYTGPCWDFDLAFDNDNRTYPISEMTGWIYATKGSYAGNMRDFVNRILSDSKAKQQLLELWQQARFNGLTEEHLSEYVAETADLLDESQQLNFLRWPILNTTVHQNVKAYGTYEKEVQVIQDYIPQRIAWMDSKVGFDPSILTGISDTPSLDDTYKEKAIYDLSGRRVSGTNAKKGIYIVNGRKVCK